MITIKEIARKANVSIGTVDRVLHNRGRVSPETEKRVREIVEKSGYKPNMIARSLSLKRELLFAVLMPMTNQDSGYWNKSKTGILKAGEDLSPYNVKIKLFYYNKYKESSFRDRFKEVLAADPSGILMAPVLSDAAEELIRGIPQKIPYLFFDANLLGANNLSFIGQNSYDSGLLAGDLMKMILPRPGSVAAIQPMVKDNHIRHRIEGFIASIHSEPGLSVKVYIPDRSGDRLSFQRLLRRLFKEYKTIDGIFVSNALCHYTADYLVEHSLESVKLIGYDLVKRNVHHLQQGVIDFLIGQRPEEQGFEGIHILHRYLAFGEKRESRIFMPLDIVTKQNLKYYPHV